MLPSKIKDICKWGSARRVDTKNGIRIVRSTFVTNEFWKIWEKHKNELKEAGVSVSKHKGGWQVTWWQTEGEYDPTDLVNIQPMNFDGDDQTSKSISKEDAIKLIDKYEKEQAAMPEQAISKSSEK